MTLFVRHGGVCLRRLISLQVRSLASATSPISIKKMVGQPPVLPRVQKHDIPRLFKLTEQQPNSRVSRGRICNGYEHLGLLFAQGLKAAQLSVDDDFLPASLHSIFVAFAFRKDPVDYHVEKLRDGKSFASRSIKGVQNGQCVFAAIANFSKPSEATISHTVKLPDVPKPDELVDFFAFCEQKLAEIKAGNLNVSKAIEDNFHRRLYDKPYSVLDVRPVDPEMHFLMKTYKNEPMRYWIKSSIELEDNPRMHRLLLAYLSDMYLVNSAVYPHISHGKRFSMVASLDNTIWFHSYFKADDWLLYETHSPVADSGRAITHGKVWTQDGRLIASTAQEILARFTDKSKL